MVAKTLPQLASLNKHIFYLLIRHSKSRFEIRINKPRPKIAYKARLLFSYNFYNIDELFVCFQVFHDTASESASSVDTMIRVGAKVDEVKEEQNEDAKDPKKKDVAEKDKEKGNEVRKPELRLSVRDMEENLKRELTLKRKESDEGSIQASPQAASPTAPAPNVGSAKKNKKKEEDSCCVIS